MAFAAHLRGLAFSDIFQILTLAKKSGILVIVHEYKTAKVYIRSGRVIQASSGKKEDRLEYQALEEMVVDETHITNVFKEIISWNEGSIYFQPKQHLDNLHDLEDGLNSEFVLLEAAGLS